MAKSGLFMLLFPNERQCVMCIVNGITPNKYGDKRPINNLYIEKLIYCSKIKFIQSDL